MTDDHTLINSKRIKIIRPLKLRLATPLLFLHELFYSKKEEIACGCMDGKLSLTVLNGSAYI